MSPSVWKSFAGIRMSLASKSNPADMLSLSIGVGERTNRIWMVILCREEGVMDTLIYVVIYTVVIGFSILLHFCYCTAVALISNLKNCEIIWVKFSRNLFNLSFWFEYSTMHELQCTSKKWSWKCEKTLRVARREPASPQQPLHSIKHRKYRLCNY